MMTATFDHVRLANTGCPDNDTSSKYLHQLLTPAHSAALFFANHSVCTSSVVIPKKNNFEKSCRRVVWEKDAGRL